MWQSYSTDPRANIPTIKKPLTRSGFTLADTISDANGVAYSDKVKLSPEEIAQHGFAGPEMESFFQSLAGKRVNYSGAGQATARQPGVGVSLSGGGRGRAPQVGVDLGGPSDDGTYQNRVNAYLSALTDQNAAGQAEHDAAFAQEQKQSEIDRAMAIANTPNVSQNGRPIVQTGPHSYATPPPDGAPVNRQAIAAQMAPGLIAPPVEKPVTFDKPEPVMVIGPDGKPQRKFVRAGSDGITYGLDRKPVDPATIAPETKAKDDYTIGTVRYSGATDKPIAGQPTKAKPTEDERKMAGFYGQMVDSVKTLDELEGALSQKELYQIQTLPQEQLTGMVNRNQLSEGAKRYLRAFEQFTEARLRPVSGAAISDSEYARDRRTYAKQFGETPKIAEDRARARGLAVDSLRKRAGVSIDEQADPGGGLPPLADGEVYATDEQGNVHKGKAGVALPKGWKLGGG